MKHQQKMMRAIREYTLQGMTVEAIAAELHVCKRTVYRYRKVLRAAGII